MATIANRIKEAMELRGMKQVDLVSLTGIGKSSISTYLSGEYEPKQKNIYKIAKALNVSEAWLMGEDVPMERTDYSELMASLASEVKSGRQAAQDEMRRLFGTEYSTLETYLCEDRSKASVLYYKAVDRRAAPELADLIATIENIDFHELEKIHGLVIAYLRADAPIREIVETALKPYKRDEFDEIPEYKMAARKSDKPHSTIGPDTDVEI